MTALLALALALQQTPAPATPAPATTQAPARRPAAAPSSTLTIHVTDRKGLAAQGVRVVAEGVVSREGTTDAVGQVLLLTVPNGTYRIQASGDGFITLEKEVVLRAGTPVPTVEFTLTAAPPPPPPPPAPAPPPAPVSTPTLNAPAGEPRVLSVIDLAERSLSGKEPTKIVPVGCSGLDMTQLLVVRDANKVAANASMDQMLYVVAGEATLTLGGRDQTISSGWYALVPRGTSHTLTRRGKNPAIVLAISGGEACAAGTR